MATAGAGFIKIVYFSPTSGDFNLGGYLEQNISNDFKISPVQQPIITQANDPAVPLANGVIYDPFQIYRSPITPGPFSSRYVVKLNPGASVSILNNLAVSCSRQVGHQFTLHGVPITNPDPFTPSTSTYQCTARLLMCRTDWEGGFDSKRHFFFDMTWRQTTDWEL